MIPIHHIVKTSTTYAGRHFIAAVDEALVTTNNSQKNQKRRERVRYLCLSVTVAWILGKDNVTKLLKTVMRILYKGI